MNKNKLNPNKNLREVIDKQKAAYLRDGPADAAKRCEMIDRLIGLLVDNEQEIVDAVASDFGHRSKDFSRITEIVSPLLTCKKTKPLIADWMRPDLREIDKGEAWVEYQPLGVIGILTPWNFPVNLVFKGLVDAFAAGNRVMLKPSEFTPNTTELIVRMMHSAFSEEEVAVVTGDAAVGEEFCSLPFDKLLFTGATSVGKHVMRAAAENLVPVILELGGKSPTILSRSANLEKAVTKIISGKAHNAGQICLSPDYLFVPEDKLDEFVSAAKNVFARLYPEVKNNPDYTSIINQKHYDRLQSYLEEARMSGCQVVELNPAQEDFSEQQHHKLPLTLLINPDDDLKVMQDEIFGPLLPIKPYREIKDVVDYINAKPRPLGLYWFGEDAAEESYVLSRTTSGGVTINDVIKHVGVESLPFGGVGASGMGSYHGYDGFLAFSHSKPVFKPADGVDLMCPPFEATTEAVKALITR